MTRLALLLAGLLVLPASAQRLDRPLGSRLIQHQQMMAAAMATAEAKLLASLSYLVWMRRQSLSRLKVLSMAFRAR